MKKACEKCRDEFQNGAYSCAHGCTFCFKCTLLMNHICPNCGGKLVKKPKGKSLSGKALLVIDVQDAFNDKKWGERNNVCAEDNINILLNEWRLRSWKVFMIKHTSDNTASLFHPENRGHQIKEIIEQRSNDIIIEKKVNSSFIHTDLEHQLRKNGISTVIVTGLTTPHCVSTSVRMSSNLGFNTILVSDATAAFGLTDHNENYIDATTVHELTLATLNDEFAKVLTTNELIGVIDRI